MNESIFLFFYSLAHRGPVSDWLIVFFADTFPYIVIILAGIFLLFHHEVFKADNPFEVLRQKYKEILLVFFSGALAWTLAHVVKFFLQLPRPVEALNGLQDITSLFEKTGYGFPSGHAAFFTALAFGIFFSHKKAGLVFILLGLLIDIARIAVGIHFPVDILGGFALGAGVAYMVQYLYPRVAYSGGTM